jgi:arylsulfatase A-like enzyme
MSTEKPNIILITIDDLRADHLSCYGYSRETSPFLDSLAQKAHTFRQAIANGPTTWPSFVSIITSSYPLLFGGYAKLSPNRTTIAQVLESHGYQTAAFLSNGYLLSTEGYEQGLDTFLDTRKRSIFSKIERRFRQAVRASSESDYGETAENVNRVVLRHLKRLSGTSAPFFVWIYYRDTHYPWLSAKVDQQRIMKREISFRELLEFSARLYRDAGRKSDEDLSVFRDMYDASISYLDRQLKYLFQRLDELKLYDNSLIVISSDHGEKLGERDGRVGHPAEMFEELIRVPLFIVGPSLQRREVDRLVSNLDIGPSIVQFAGLPEVPCFQGRSLFEEDPREAKGLNEGYFVGISHAKAFTFDERERLVAYRTEEWKYIRDEKTGMRQLFNLRSDPGEENNIIGTGIREEPSLAEIVDQHIQEIGEKGEEVYQIDDKVKKQLRKLGYIE